MDLKHILELVQIYGPTIVAYLGSGAVVAYVSQLTKFWKRIESSRVMQTLSGLFALLGAFAQQIVTNPGAFPAQIVQVGGGVWICSQIVYQVSKFVSELKARYAMRRATKNIPEATADFTT
jgi:hypothetical protein